MPVRFTLGQMPQQGVDHEVFAGPAREVRMERAFFSREGDEWLERPRQLRAIIGFSRSGTLARQEWWGYRQDGTPRGVSVTEYDADGRTVLAENRDAEGLLHSRSEGAWEGGVWVSTHETYKPAGTLARTSVYRYDYQQRPLDTPDWRGGRTVYLYDGAGRPAEVRLERDGIAVERAVHHYQGEVEESVVYGADGAVLRRGRQVRDMRGDLIERLFTEADGSVCYHWKRTEHDSGDPAAVTECATCAGQLAAAMARRFAGVRIVTDHVHEHMRDTRTGQLRSPKDLGTARVLDAAGHVTIETHHEDWASWHSLRRFDSEGRLQESWHETTSGKDGSVMDGHAVLTYDEAGRNMETLHCDPDGSPRQRRTREYDRAGNWVREVLYKRPAKGTVGPLESARVAYRTITYC